MAFSVLEWAYRQPLKAPLKPVLVALAWHADETGVAWPGAATLAKETGYSRRTILGALSRLEELGVIVALKYPKGGAGKATEWRLYIEKGAGDAPFKGAGDAPLEPSRVQEVHRKGAAHAQKGAGGAHQQSEQSGTKSARGEDLEDLRSWLSRQPTEDGGDESLHPLAVDHAIRRVNQKRFDHPRAAALKIARDEHPRFAREQADEDRRRAARERTEQCGRCEGMGVVSLDDGTARACPDCREVAAS